MKRSFTYFAAALCLVATGEGIGVKTSGSVLRFPRTPFGASVRSVLMADDLSLLRVRQYTRQNEH